MQLLSNAFNELPDHVHCPISCWDAADRLVFLPDLAHDQVLRVVDENRRLQSLVKFDPFFKL